MKQTIYNVDAMRNSQVIALGRQCENNYRQIVFDCSGFGDGVTGVTLVHQRSADVAPYIVASATENTLTWTITDTDTAFYGFGKCELRVSFADGLAKSYVFGTLVVKSITADTVIPDALQSWYDAMIDYIDQHSTTPEQIEAAVEEYLETHPISAPVQSVNGMTGAVVLTASDVGALADSVTIPTKTSDLTNDSGYLTTAVTSFNGETGAVTYTPPVSSVNGKTGAVSLNSADVGALPDTYTAPVQSVNGQTGAVTVTVPTKTSDLTNDSGFITSAPVSSVDGKTGAVTVIPTGGTTGQVLAKASNTDRDVEWVNQSGGGGDTWRVIADLTLTEEVLSINITEDSNGNPLSLKEFRVFASVPKCTQASTGQWGVNSYWLDSSGGFNTGSGRHGSFAMKLNPDNTATSIIEQFGIGGYNNTNFSAINGGFYDGRLIEARSFPNGFTAIRLRQSNTSYNLPVGTHIYMYGVDL